MVFQNPSALILILPLALAVFLLALYARARRRRAAAAFADAVMGARIIPEAGTARFWTKLALWEAAAILVLIALARPQWGELVEEVKIRGSDLYVMIDVSRSMLSTDVKPSRLGRAKADVSELLNHLQGERVGLIAFAGRAAVKCPLTSDYTYVRAALDELGPNSVDVGGTAIGDAIRVALHVFAPVADRDQAILLITDGDDQDSQPELAAAEAAEKHVTIFTVGLGDPTQGAVVPDKEGSGKAMQYEGHDVISKMGEKVLSEIARQTNGAYVPAGTSNYDLGALYQDKLSQLRGDYVKEQKRTRQAERFEIPLLLAVLCFLIELLTRPHRTTATASAGATGAGSGPFQKAVGRAALLLLALSAVGLRAGDAASDANEGLAAYAKKEFATAGEKFSEAQKALPKEQSEEAARAVFDAGCAFQRAGDFDKAKDAYMQATLARDKALAASAQFNLGNLLTEKVQKLSGEKPEAIAEVPAEKRGEIIDTLKAAAGFYRSCLDLQPEHAGARKNIELIRAWLKQWVDRWNALDRQKRRDSMNLLQFLDYLAQTEKALRAATRPLADSGSPDEFAEVKRAQDELIEEIEPLKEKVLKDLAPPQQTMTAPGQQAQAPAIGGMTNEQRAEAIKTLKQWADEARDKMKAAGTKLGGNSANEAAVEEKAATQVFERMQDAVSPFQATLAQNLRDQTGIAQALKPPEKDEEEKPDDKAKSKADEKPEAKKPAVKPEPDPAQKALEEAAQKDLNAELAEQQGDTSRRTALMKLKAQKELEEFDKKAEAQKSNGAPNATPPKPEKEKEWLTIEDMKREEAKKRLDEEAAKAAKNGQTADPKAKEKENGPPTPEQIRKGLQTAIDLAPKAIDKMESALAHLKKNENVAAYPDAESARKILQEIQDAQPNQKQDDKDKKKDDKQDQKNQDQKKKDEQKKDEQKKDQDKKDQDKKDQNKDKKDEEKQDGKPQPQKLTKEQAEAMLRKVREKEMERRKKKADERDALLAGRPGTDKDW